MTEQDNLKVAMGFFEAWNAGDLSKADQYEDDHFVSESPGSPGPLNKEQNRKYNQNFLTAFPGSQFKVLRTVMQGEFVVIHWSNSGTHGGPLETPSGGTIPPTGKSATVVGSSTFQIKNGKIVHTWNFWDMTSLLFQLGLMPPM